jgi:DNA polymerase III epsilon subunit-like protein
MYCIVDTEGSGLFRYKNEDGSPVPADAPGQPRLASLAMIFADADLNVEREYHAFVRPDGWEMPEATTKIHGLTQEFLLKNGVPVIEVLKEYTAAIESGRVLVAHNVQHDAKQLRAELRRAGLPDLFEQTPNFCTMRSLTNVCKIPPNGGRGAYKWPKLSEACVFFGMTEYGDHSSLNDARAVVGLMREMKKRGIKFPEAMVHFAKVAPQTQQDDPPPAEAASLADLGLSDDVIGNFKLPD